MFSFLFESHFLTKSDCLVIQFKRSIGAFGETFRLVVRVLKSAKFWVRKIHNSILKGDVSDNNVFNMRLCGQCSRCPLKNVLTKYIELAKWLKLVSRHRNFYQVGTYRLLISIKIDKSLNLKL